MSLKTSLFNKSVIKSDFKRLWWVGALYALLIFTSFTFVYLEYILTSQFQKVNMFLQTPQFMNYGKTSIFFSFFFPVGLATLIFSYLNSSSAVSCLHGLPVKRKTFFASHILSGSLLMIIPIILNAVILLFFRINPVVASSYLIVDLFRWAGVFTIYSLLIFFGASMVAIICANNVATIIFTYIFAGLPVLAEAFCLYFLDEHLYGFSQNNTFHLTNFLYHSPDDLLKNGWFCFKYVIFASVFLFLAYFFYKKRKLEYNAEIVAFPKLKPVFVYGVGICTGAFGYSYLVSFLSTKNILLLIPFGILGIVIAEMIAKKTLKPKKILKPIIIFSVAIIVLQFAFQIDITGFERRIPSPDKVQCVTYNDGTTGRTTYKNYSNYGEVIYYDEETDFNLYDEKSINDVIRLHNELITNRTSYKDTELDLRFITLSYTLKNGRTLTREYLVNYKLHKEFLEPIVESETVRKMYFPILRAHHKDYISLRISDQRLNESGKTYFADDEIFKRLLAALKEDAKNTDYDEFAARTNELTEIHLYYTTPAKYEDGTLVPKNNLPETHEYYKIRDDYKNTLAILDQIGFYDNLPTYEDIKSVGIDHYMSGRPYTVIDSTIEANSKYSKHYHKFIENPDEIKEIYEYMTDNYNDFDSYDSVCEFNLEDYSFRFEYNSKVENLPKALKNEE